MRNAMITTLTEDYVLLAEAKGLSERRVMLSYAARNAILTNVIGMALSLGFYWRSVLTEWSSPIPALVLPFCKRRKMPTIRSCKGFSC